MKNSKKLFLIVLSVLIIAFVSCKSNENPEGGSSNFTVSSIVGTWTSTVSAGNTFTIDNAGKIALTASSTTVNLTIGSWEMDKDLSVSQYQIPLVDSGTTYTFTFKSANSCELSKSGETAVEPFTKQ